MIPAHLRLIMPEEFMPEFYGASALMKTKAAYLTGHNYQKKILVTH